MNRNINTTGLPIHAGDRRRIWAKFQDAAGDFTDPDGFTLILTEGAGAATTINMAGFIRDAPGQFYYDHTFTQSGRCKIVATAIGTIQEVQPGYLVVENV